MIFFLQLDSVEKWKKKKVKEKRGANAKRFSSPLSLK